MDPRTRCRSSPPSSRTRRSRTCGRSASSRTCRLGSSTPRAAPALAKSCRGRRSRCACRTFSRADKHAITMEIVDVLRARQRIVPYVRRTPLVESPWLSAAASARVALKLESLQRSNSFKARGAFNAVIARLDDRSRRQRTLVTASAGNHGRALADAAATFGLPLVVFTPADAPAAKLDAIRHHGATLRAESADYDEAERRAKAFAAETGGDFISPYNDPEVI